MTRRRNTLSPADVAAWADFDAAALAPQAQDVFTRRRLAVELYAAGTALTEIEAQTGVDRRQLYRFFERCTQPHEDGRPFGLRALVRYLRVAGYERIRPFKTTSASGFGAAAGAFNLLLQTYPSLPVWISQQVKSKRVALEQISTDGRLQTRLRNLKHVHAGFLQECRKLGLTPPTILSTPSARPFVPWRPHFAPSACAVSLAQHTWPAPAI